MLGNHTTSQGLMKDCYFLSALDALFENPQLTQYVMQDIQQVNPQQFWVNRADGKRVWVDLSQQPDFPGRVYGPLAYQVLEAAYRDLPLQTIAPYPSSFDQGGYSVDVWLALLKRAPGLNPVQVNGTNWETSLADYGQYGLVESVLYQAASQSPPALITATTINPPQAQLTRSRQTYPGLGGNRCWVYRMFGQEWVPHHVYSVVGLGWNDNGLTVTIDNPYLTTGQAEAKTTLSLPQFMQLFSRFDAMQFMGG
jgi:hypothetical protein